MRAIAQDRYGGVDALELRQMAKPVPGDDDVLVAVRAASAHLGDWHLMTGLPYLIRIMGYGLRAPKATVRGTDFAGVVEAVGGNVTDFKPGDEVFGVAAGTFAEYAVARPGKIAPKPASLTFEQAAAVPTSATTALQALRDRGNIQPGQQVLIIGAGGGVGTYAVQLAKALGAQVTGVCSTTKVDLVRSLGADRVIDYTREDFASSGRRYDLIIDTAGNRPLSQLRRALAPRGTLVIVGAEGGGRWLGPVDRLLRAMLVSPLVSQRLTALFASDSTEDLVALTRFLEDGSVTPVIGRTFPLPETRHAIGYLGAGHARGKVVIVP
ncbi:MAG: NAD(P)-dependent alcohol dehydrogenase [Actinomycetota bacterium]|nr:NAD(P)-dependent alcohol dehydrogenase [Actinomycetota bacterium]